MPPARSALLALTLLAALAGEAQALASFEEVRREFRPSDVRVLDRDGELLQRVRTDRQVRRGQWIALAEMSPALRTAMVLSEDKRFYAHSGVDWRAVSAAAWGNVWNTRTRGASTITMQLAGLLDDDLRRGSGGRNLAQKFGQTVAAQQLERSWRKDQILEAYLNTVPFRGEIVGIDALSRTLFGKAPHGLDAREAAVAAALVRAPNAKPALVAQRACEVMRALEAGTKVDCEALDMFASAALQRKAFEASEGIAPHLARRALALSHNEELRTTLRAPLQRFALTTLQRHLRELRGRNVEDGALVVLDNASGDVLAWVGSSGDLSRAAEVDGVLAQRQPGSTLKPLLYAQAIAERRLTAASLLDDSSAQISTTSGLYIPQNYDRQFKGHVSVRTALAASLNVPAVRTLVMVSPAAFARQLRASGLALAQNGDYYGYSLALGSAEVSLLGLTNAYRTLANRGRVGETRFLPARLAADATRNRTARCIHRRRHPQRCQCARTHLRPRQRARHALLERGEDRHQQGHARQLGHRLVGALHGRRVGRQCERRADVGRERHQRRRARVGRADGLPAPQRAQPGARAAAGPGALARALRRRARGGTRRMVHRRHRAAAVRPSRRRGRVGRAHHRAFGRHHHRARPRHPAAAPARALRGRGPRPAVAHRRQALRPRRQRAVAALAGPARGGAGRRARPGGGPDQARGARRRREAGGGQVSSAPMKQQPSRRKPAKSAEAPAGQISAVLARIEALWPSLGPVGQRIADFIVSQPQEVVHMSVSEVAERTGSSEGSIVGFCKNLGATGFQQIKIALAQEIVRPVQFIHEDLEPGDKVSATIRKIFQSNVQTLHDTQAALDVKSMEKAVKLIKKARRIEIYGIGSAATIAEDAHYRMLRIGLDVKVVVDSHVQAISASLAGPDVAVLTVSHSGSTHETVTATRLAKEAGASTICITNFGKSPIQAFCDVLLFTMARETSFRTEAMTSRLAQLAIIDALIACLALVGLRPLGEDPAPDLRRALAQALLSTPRARQRGAY